MGPKLLLVQHGYRIRNNSLMRRSRWVSGTFLSTLCVMSNLEKRYKTSDQLLLQGSFHQQIINQHGNPEDLELYGSSSALL